MSDSLAKPLSRQKLLAALRRQTCIPDPTDKNRELWQIAQNQYASYLYGAIAMGEFDEDEETKDPDPQPKFWGTMISQPPPTPYSTAVKQPLYDPPLREQNGVQ